MQQYHSRVNLSWNFFVDLSSAPCSYAPTNYWYNCVREGAGLPASRASFEVFRTSQSCFLWSNWFIRVKHLFIVKTMAINEPDEASARLLGLGSKLYPSTLVPSVFVPLDQLARLVKPACAVRDEDSRYEIDILATCRACSVKI